MLFHFFAAAEAQWLGKVQADVLDLPALLLDPFLHGLFVFNDFDAGLEGFERHARKAFGVEFAEADLVIVVVRGTEDSAAHTALGDEGVGALWRVDFGFVWLIKSLDMLFENPAHRLLF